MHIGVDFDNTIAAYDKLLAYLAVEKKVLPFSPLPNKILIRESVRATSNGENSWQYLQALAYGPYMPEAELMPDVGKFFQMCKEAGIKISIVSHKTRFPSDPSVQVDLREAAWNWMKKYKFFSDYGFGLNPDQIFFESSRDKKIDRIRALRCTHFIDDLEEIFMAEKFPEYVRPMLFAPSKSNKGATSYDVFNSWNDIRHEFLSC